MTNRQELVEQLNEIEQSIKDLEKRIPPHSVQPHLIARLDDLEAARDRILQALDEKTKAE